MPEIRRMRCSGLHRMLLAVPDDAVFVSETYGHLGQAGGDPIVCSSTNGPCYDMLSYAGVHAPMKLVIVRGEASHRACSRRCFTATGLDCECGCAGANHGRAAR